MRRRTVWLAAATTVSLPVLWLSLVAVDSDLPVRWVVRQPAPADALERFYTYEGGEDMLMDPLILAGPKVVPAVVRAIESPGMPRRRYAILFLGNSGDRAALPALRRILESDAELDYFRGDALESIDRIDSTEGRSAAGRYASRNDYLGRIARQIVTGTRIRLRRTYLDALHGRHD